MMFRGGRIEARQICGQHWRFLVWLGTKSWCWHWNELGSVRCMKSSCTVSRGWTGWPPGLSPALQLCISLTPASGILQGCCRDYLWTGKVESHLSSLKLSAESNVRCFRRPQECRWSNNIPGVGNFLLTWLLTHRCPEACSDCSVLANFLSAGVTEDFASSLQLAALQRKGNFAVALKKKNACWLAKLSLWDPLLELQWWSFATRDTGPAMPNKAMLCICAFIDSVSWDKEWVLALLDFWGKCRGSYGKISRKAATKYYYAEQTFVCIFLCGTPKRWPAVAS